MGDRGRCLPKAGCPRFWHVASGLTTALPKHGGLFRSVARQPCSRLHPNGSSGSRSSLGHRIDHPLRYLCGHPASVEHSALVDDFQYRSKRVSCTAPSLGSWTPHPSRRTETAGPFLGQMRITAALRPPPVCLSEPTGKVGLKGDSLYRPRPRPERQRAVEIAYRQLSTASAAEVHFSGLNQIHKVSAVFTAHLSGLKPQCLLTDSARVNSCLSH
jgi:hypothetical protein